MNLNIIPEHSSGQAREKHNKSAEWLMFARKIPKHPFVKQFLLNRDNHICQWCGWNIDGMYVIHHISYDHICSRNELIKVHSPTESNPKRNVNVPNCSVCQKETPKLFEGCMSLLVAVHPLCNKKIDEARNREQKGCTMKD